MKIFKSLPAILFVHTIAVTLSASGQDSSKIKLAPGALTKTNLPAGAFNPSENTTPPLPFVAGSWTLAVLPDTQVYAMKHPELFDKQTRWIVENKTKHNIAYVLHLGDIVNNNNEPQWKNAQRSMFLLDGHVPYAMAPGNHDFGKNGSSDSRQTFFNDYFPLEKYRKWPTFGGAMEEGKMENTFHTFKAGGNDWLVLALEWGPRNKVPTWCNEVIVKHPNHKLILITHAYMYYDETRYDWKAKGTNQTWNPYNYRTAKDPDGTNDGEDLWNKVVRKHSNFVMTMNGHVIGDGLGRMSSVGDHGNVVHQLLVNYQMKYLGGEAFLRLVEFLPDGETVQVKAYSPHYDKYKTDPQNQFVLKLKPKLKGTSVAAAAAKDTFDVILLSLPADKKISVIKAVRELKPSLGLAAAKTLVESAPTSVLQGANKADSDAARKLLEAAGAKVEVK